MISFTEAFNFAIPLINKYCSIIFGKTGLKRNCPLCVILMVPSPVDGIKKHSCCENQIYAFKCQNFMTSPNLKLFGIATKNLG